MEHFQSGRCPAAFALVSMDFGTASVGIIEVTPCQDMDPSNAHVSERGDVSLDELLWVGRHAGDDTP